MIDWVCAINSVAASGDKTAYALLWDRAVANGPVGPAMAGPIIESVILIVLIFLKKIFFYLIYFPTGPIIEPVILIFAICVNTDSP